MRSILLSLLYFLPIAIAQALPIEAGTFSDYDQYDQPVGLEDSEYVRSMQQHLAASRKGGEVRLATIDEMNVIWPSGSKGAIEIKAMPYQNGFLFERLMRPDPLGESRTNHGHLVESITIKKDLKTVVMNVRPGVTFSDGSKFTAQDVWNSYVFTREVEGGPAYDSWYQDRFGTPKFRVLDDLHLEISFVDLPVEKMRTALYAFAEIQGVKLNPKPKAFELPNEYIGTGPYVVTYATSKTVIMKRRPEYWASARPFYNFDVIRVERFGNKSVAREALTSGTITFLGESDHAPTEALKETAKRSTFEPTEVDLTKIVLNKFSSNVLPMNMKNVFLSDLRVRKAIALAYDAPAAMYAFFGDHYSALPALGTASEFRPAGLARPEVLASMNDPQFAGEITKPFEESGLMEGARLEKRRDRLRRATDLLREAGYLAKGGRLYKNDRPVVFRALVPAGGLMLRSLLFLQWNLRFLGIQLDIQQAIDDAQYTFMLHAGDYDMITDVVRWPRLYKELPAEYLAYSYATINSVAMYPKGTGQNASNLQSPAIDKILDDLQNLAPGSKAYADLNEAFIRLMNAAVPFVPLGDANRITYFHDRRICVPPSPTVALIAAYLCH